MKVTKIRYGLTKKTSINYNSVSPSLVIEADIDPDEDYVEAYQELKSIVNSYVEEELEKQEKSL